MISRLIGVIFGFLLGFALGCAFEYVADHTNWKSKTINRTNNPKSKIKQFFCNHKEEECIQIPLPYNIYNTKCCFKCKKCGHERWANWYWNNGISEFTPIPAPPKEWIDKYGEVEIEK